MTHGKDLTEYTSFELRVILNAIAREKHFVISEGGPNIKYNDALDQWKTKIIEAIAEVRMSEINTTEN